MECEHAELGAFYRRYLQRCNEHRFFELSEFVERNDLLLAHATRRPSRVTSSRNGDSLSRNSSHSARV